jgi:hypothetical protein
MVSGIAPVPASRIRPCHGPPMSSNVRDGVAARRSCRACARTTISAQALLPTRTVP